MYCLYQELSSIFIPLCVFTENQPELNLDVNEAPDGVGIEEMAGSSTKIDSPLATPLKRTYPFNGGSSSNINIKPAKTRRNTLLSSLKRQLHDNKTESNNMCNILTEINKNLGNLVEIEQIKLQLKYPNVTINLSE